MEFEAAFKRLEEILEKMQTQNPSLDESIKMYEEADKLIQLCANNLSHAEKRIEVIQKNREGNLEIGANEQPVLMNFEV